MTSGWVAFCNGVEVARGATPEETIGLALLAGFPSREIRVHYENLLPGG